LRALAQSAARELGPRNIHVAHLIIDAGVDTAWVRERIRESGGDAALAGLAPGRLMRPDAVADAYGQLYQQPAAACTFELEIRRFIDRHRITRFQSNPFFPVNTLTLMRGAIAARSLGVFERYVAEMFRHMWADPKKMDDPHVLRAALEESGLDAERFFELVQTREIKAELLANTERSVARGTFGAPTFFVGAE